MDNVVYLPGKERLNEKEVLVDIPGFEDFVTTSDFPDVISYAVKGLITSPYMKDFPEDYWNHVRLVRGNADDDTKAFCIETVLRPTQIGEFGTQSHLIFLGLSYGYTDEGPLIKEMPHDLLDQMNSYFQSYPTMNATLTLMVHAFMASLIEHPDTNFVSVSNEDDVFYLYLVSKNKTDKGWLRLGFWTDFLPLLLDDAAMRLVIQNAEKE